MKTIITVLLSVLSVQLAVFAQGPLTPPGPPVPTMKTLEQIEPRIPIASVPYTITASGSYYLTTNLTCTACSNGVDGIQITANSVTLDLNGFSLTGISGSGNGVWVSTLVRSNIAVRSGTVRGWGSDGIDASHAWNSQFIDLRLSDNAGDGLNAANPGVGKLIRGCIATGNAVGGIEGSCGTEISSCAASRNSGTGITVISNSTITACAASFNGTDGIQAGWGNTVTGCAAGGNGRHGVVAFMGCTVSGCTALGNASNGFSTATLVPSVGYVIGSGNSFSGCTAQNNGGDGIWISSDNVAVNNLCSGNSQAGIRATASRNRVDSNQLTTNAWGLVISGTNNLIIRNSASGNTTANYSFTGTQTFGPTNNLVGAGGVITNQNPWANFGF